MSTSARTAALMLLAAVASSCSRKAPAPAAAAATASAALFVNGGFEDGTLTGWTKDLYRNNGLAAVPPTSFADLNLQQPGVADHTGVRSGTIGSIVPAGLSTGTTLRVPKYSTHVAVVNEQGASNSANGLRQTMTTSNADVDPSDNKVHIRFAIAPVLQNPGHADTQQPYFWVQLMNVTKGTQLFHTFNFANQTGVPWKTDPAPPGGQPVQYTDWQAFDIAPGPAQLAVGDQVEMLVVASGCAAGGHWGHVYVESFGPKLPGITVTATAPQQVNTLSTLTYTFAYRNDGNGASTNTTIVENLPTGTTFQSVSAPGASCTTPTAGNTGTVTCNVGTVNPASSGSFTVTVNVTGAIGSTISNGDYNIYADSVSALIGPLVTTSVTSGVLYADLSATVSDGVAAVGWGSTTNYTLTVRNSGPAAGNLATLSDPLPTNVVSWSWTCAAAVGAACPNASGAGAINETIATFPIGGSLTYAIHATVAGSGTGSLVHQATVTAPAGVTDNNNTNDIAVDTDSIGTLRTLTITKDGTGQGAVVSSPVALSCGSTCFADFTDGTAVVLTAMADPGYGFYGWSGGGCSGSGTCTVSLTGDELIFATFGPIQWNVTGATNGNGTVSCASPVNDGLTTTCTITPSVGYRLSALNDSAAGDVLASVSGGVYTTSALTVNRTVTATFAPSLVTNALSAAPVSSVFGQSVTFTATLTGVNPAGLPGGTVAFKDNGATIAGCGAVALTATGATTSDASCTTSALAVGTRPITAVSSGDASYGGVTSAVTSYVVGKASTSVALVDSPSSPTLNGVPVTLTATVSTTGPGVGTPAGTVSFTDGGSTIAGCAGVALVGGVAGCTTQAMLGVATHTFQATYSGNGSFNGSPASSIHVVQRLSPTVALVSDGSPSLFGAPVTFTVAVSNGLVTPTGLVTVMEGATILCGPIALSGGTASCGTTALAVGTHAVATSYGGDQSFLPTVSSAISQLVVRSTATTDVSGDLARSVYGQTVTFTATVTPDAPSTVAATGTVTFRDAATVICNAVPLAGSQATCAVSTLTVGWHAVSARYNGSTGYAPSTSFSTTVQVDQASTSVALTPSPAATVFGQAVTLSVDVTAVLPGTGSPTGTVTLSDGGVAVAGCANLALNGSGHASCSTSALAVGTHQLSTGYGGETRHLSSSAGPQAFTVGKAATSAAVASAPNPSIFGQSVTFTATVATTLPGAGAPSGTVTFSDGATVLGTGPLDGAGHATLTTGSLVVGSHGVTAVYAGDASFLGSTSAASAHLVNQAPTTTVVASSAAPSVYGQPVTLTAHVAASGAGVGLPTGNVTFLDGATSLGFASLNGGGDATLSTSALTAGSHAITAVYGGDASFLTSTSASFTHGVTAAATSVALAAAPNPAVFGQAVTLTATASAVAPSTATPAGTVTFYDGATPLGSAALDGTGHASLQTSALPVGAHALTAALGASAAFQSSTSPQVAEVVNHADTATALVSSSPASVFGEQVTYTATVTTVLPGAGTPSGTVVFKDGATTLGSGTLSGGVATLQHGALAVGTHALTAEYQGDARFNASASPGALQTVNQAATAAVAASSPNPTVFGQPTTITATVTVTSPGAGTPTGRVTFSDGAATLGTGSLDGTGHATLATGALAVGTHQLTAAYAGDASFLASTSASAPHVVNQAATSASVATSGSPSIYGQAVTFTAHVTVTAPGAGTPTGTVTFSDGATTLGTGTLSSAGDAVLTTSTLAAGVAHGVTACYAGAPSFLASASAAVAQAVSAAGTSLALSSAPNPSVFGETVTLQVLATAPAPSTATPSGTLSFSDGATLLGTAVLDGGGRASLATGALAVGTHGLTATLAASASFQASTSAQASQVVGKAATATALVSSAPFSTFGQSITLTATVTPVAPGAGVSSGTVAFMDGATTLGTGTLDSGGVASIAYDRLGGGPHMLSADYQGDASFDRSTAAGALQNVAKARAAVALVSAPIPSVFGQSVTWSATVTSQAFMPSGTVTFKEGATVVLGTGTLDGSGRASFSKADLAVGNHDVLASYGGSADHDAADSAPATQQVNKDDVDATVAASPATTVFGQATTVTATVTARAPGAGTPGGTVTFLEGSAVLGTRTLDGAGHASAQVTSLAAQVQAHAVTARYEGDGSFLTGTAATPAAVTVGKAQVAIAASTPGPTSFGQPVNVSITLSAVSPGSGTPGGPVSVHEGAVKLCGPVTLSSGAASCSTSALTPGSHTLTVQYEGDGSFVASSKTLTQQVNSAATTLGLSASPSPAHYGQKVTLTAAVAVVAPGQGTPTGSLTFKKDGIALGSPVALVNGQAALPDQQLPAQDAPYALTAAYAGDGNFAASNGSASLTVLKATTTVQVDKPAPVRRLHPVILTAHVTSADATPTGTVAFSTGGRSLGTAQLDGQGQAVVTVRDLVKGTYPVTADYQGTSDFATGTVTVPDAVVVGNTPPVAGAGTALALGPTAAASATATPPAGVLDGTKTVELWAQAPGDLQAELPLVRLGAAADPRLALGVAADRKSVVLHLGAAVTTYAAPLDDGRWHHLAVVAGDQQTSVLLDGQVLAPDGGTAATAPGAQPVDKVVLGEGFVGALDEVRLWTAARTAGDLQAAMRRPQKGDEASLAALWRMDEGSGYDAPSQAGLTAYDAGPNHLDATVALANPPSDPSAPQPAVFAPSDAWRAREAKEERWSAPIDAGYDVDGDPHTLTVSAQPAHGQTATDATALTVKYKGEDHWLGADTLTFSLSDDESSSSYTVDIAVTHIVACSADADCGGGDVCLQNVCVAPPTLDARSGAGCSTGGGGAALWSLLALGWLALRRSRSGGTGVKAAAVLLATALAASPLPASAQAAKGFALQTYEPAPAGDTMFFVPDPSVQRHAAPAASLLMSWSADPLVLRQNGQVLPGFRVVHRQSWAIVQGSVPVADALLLDVALPFAFYQSGSQPLNDLAQVSSAGIGDVRLGARVPIPLGGPVRLAAALDLWLPTGSRESFSSDGSVRVLPKLVVGLERGSWVYGVEAGFLVRNSEDLGYTKLGPAIAFSGGVAWRWRDLRVGPEIYGRHQFAGTATSPIEALLGGRWQRGPMELGLAVGTALDTSPGAAPFRAVAQLTWRSEPGRARAVEAVAAAPPAPEVTVAVAAPVPVAPAVHRAEVGSPRPPAPAPLAVVRANKIEILRTIRFENDRTVLKPESEAVLRDVAAILAAHPEIGRVVIEGHTDARGDAAHNSALSERRALAVRDWLVARGGIGAERLQSRGFGARLPIASNETEQGRARNRRVEFGIVGRK